MSETKAANSKQEQYASEHIESEAGQSKSDTARLKEIRSVLARNHITRGVSPEKLRNILEELGPTFVKLGQIMSLHSDILPQRYCDELLKLDSQVRPMPFDDMIGVIERSYRVSWQSVFASIDETPLGSASIAQVHRAILNTGEEVIIKVQRAGIYDIMARDIRMLKKAVRHLPPVGDLRNLVDLEKVLEEMWNVTQEELNFLQEADNMEEFSRYNQGINYVYVPRLYREHTTTHVLVMEYIDGWNIDDKKHLLEAGYDLHEIGVKLVNNYIKQIMEDGFFHADPHPGNVKVRDGKIVWIDMGMMGRLSARDKDLLASAVEGIAVNDISRLQRSVLALGEFWAKPDREKLYQGIRDLLQDYGSTGMGDIKIPDMLRDLTDVMKENHIGMPHGLTMLARGLTHMEGVLAIIDPDTNMLDIAKTRIQEQAFTDVNLKKELKKSGWKMYQSMRKGVEIPSLATDIMKEYLQGQARMNMELKTSQDLAFLMRKLVRNMVTGLWVSTLVLASAILCLTDMEPKIFGMPVLGALGFFASFVIVLYVVIVHIVTRKK